jgi:uncharacterized protein YndB with AHSA1/START domain
VARIRVRTVIDAPRHKVWRDVKDLASHVEWMDDAEEIEFTTARHSGVGTGFRCRTRVGPVRFDDHMVVTQWEPPRCIGIHHDGVVTGEGLFTLRRRVRGGTVFRWEERLHFPWWLAGPLGGALARPLLRRVWRRNLANLARRLSS